MSDFKIVEGQVFLTDDEGNVLGTFDDIYTGNNEKVLRVKIWDGHEHEDEPPHFVAQALKREHTTDEHSHDDMVLVGARDDELLIHNIQTKELLENILVFVKKIYVIGSMIIGDEIKDVDTKDLE